jgi:hypothetical protein
VNELTPRAKARWVGIFEILAGTFTTTGQITIMNKVIVSGNAAATAANILKHETMFRFGFAFCLFGAAFHLAWALLFYELYKPVSRTIARFGLLTMALSCAVLALGALFYISPLLTLTAGSSLTALTPDQLRALAYAFIKLNGANNNINLVFFGLWCALSGYLIARSNFLPRVLGWLLILDGIGWMFFVAPPLGNYLFPFIAVVCGLAEVPLPWFFIFGFDAQRWEEHVRRHAIARAPAAKGL